MMAQERIDTVGEPALEKSRLGHPSISHGPLLQRNAGSPVTLAESLRRAARQSPDKGIVYVQSDRSETFQSYPELLEAAGSVLTGLRNIGLKPGDKVIFQLDRNQDFVAAFWGCMLGGIVPVPLSIPPTYQTVNGAVSNLHKVWKSLGQPVIVSGQKLAPAIRSSQTLIQPGSFCVEVVDDLRTCSPSLDLHVARPDDPAVLLSTSGSSGLPKTVVQSHRALIYRSAASAQLNGFTPDEVSLNWLPMDHVGALVRCHLLNVFLGCQQIQVQTEVVLGDPLKWLDLISRHKASVTWAPNFAYGLVNAAAVLLHNRQWNLSSMRFILNGGEAINPKTSRRFLRLLAPYGLSACAMHPAWGMSETASAATYSNQFSLDSTSDDDSFVEVGIPIPGVSLRIVDEGNAVVEEGNIGSLQVKGTPITQGYYDNPEANAAAFTDDGWFRTGDLGFLRNGRLTITGREKDVIIVNGVNYSGHVVEAAIEELDGVERSWTAACAVRVSNAETDKLAVFFNPTSWADGDLTKLLRLIRLKVIETAGINPDYLLPVEKEAIPKSSIGKIQRLLLSAHFQRGEFNALVERIRTLSTDFNVPATPPVKGDETDSEPGEVNGEGTTPVERQIAEFWREVLDVPHVKANDNFFERGGHSLLAARVIHRIRQGFGVPLTLRSLFDAPTVTGLAKLVERGVADSSAMLPPLRLVSRAAALPLSFSQQRLWFLEQWHPDIPVYNIPIAYRLTGSLNFAALERGLNEIIRRHESLRTFFTVDSGQPVQRIAPALAVPIPTVELCCPNEAEREAEAQRLVNDHARRPFDLSQAPLLRVILFRLAANDHILLLTLHHIVSDGWSLDILNRELAIFYNAFCNDELSPLPALEHQYVDYAAWQRDWLQNEVLERQLRYWKQQLDGMTHALRLPFDRPRPAMQTYHGARRSFALSQRLTQALQSLSRKTGVTLFMTQLAAFQTLLYRYSGQDEIVVGTPIAGRDNSAVEGLIGFFVNTLVLRADLSGNPAFRDLLVRVREMTLGAYAHQDLPFEKLVAELLPERRLSQSPLFQVLFSYQNMPTSELQFLGLRTVPLEISTDTAKFDLTLTMIEEAGSLMGSVEYNTDLFDAATVERMVDHYQTLLEGIVANPGQCIGELPLLTAAEKHQVLVEWNDTQADYPKDKCVHELFEEQVERTPDDIALVFDDQQWTYRELNSRANQLARYLQSCGVRPQARVGICVERSLELIVGLLGILKAGGVYVPLDANYPVARLQYMLEDTQAPILITQENLVEASAKENSSLASVMADAPCKVVCLARDWKEIETQSRENLDSEVSSDRCAYIIYTSGSIGKPKGVEVSHRGIARLVFGADYADFGVDRTFLHLAPTAFDASTFEIWGALLHGGKCVLYPSRVPSAAELAEVLTKHGVTTLWLTASLYNWVIDEAPQALLGVKQVLVGGEALSLTHVRKGLEQLPQTQLINGYGPTESTTFACCYRIPRRLDAHLRSIPIGKPIGNTRVYVLDSDLNPVPIGMAGELYIGGDGLALGYLNDAQLTAAKFIKHCFDGEPAQGLYRTGDRARYLPDSNIEFLGRLDNQVKIRGYRIELGEIETVLAQHRAVRESVVIAREDEAGFPSTALGTGKQLVAYVVPKESAPPASELRAHLKAKLPDYMVPSAFVILDFLPLTPNGKVDRNALPPFDRDTVIRDPIFVAPGNAREKAIADIWAEILGVKRISVHDNFFDLGGHSLKATQVVSRLRKAFQSDIPLRHMFEFPTIAELAAVIDPQKEKESEGAKLDSVLREIEALSEDEARRLLTKTNNG